jgi:hypothetical protein
MALVLERPRIVARCKSDGAARMFQLRGEETVKRAWSLAAGPSKSCIFECSNYQLQNRCACA